jgi:type IV pilus biogenesis protein CpaD/CtpE
MKKLILSCVACAALLSLTGCDTDKDSHSSTTTTQQTTTPAPVTTTTTDTTQSK